MMMMVVVVMMHEYDNDDDDGDYKYTYVSLVASLYGVMLLRSMHGLMQPRPCMH